MAHYTILTNDSLISILDQYGLRELVFGKVLSGGSQNTNYHIKCSDGEFVLTFCEQNSYDEALQLAELLDYLKTSGFSTSKVIRNDEGSLITIWNEKPIIFKEFLVGEVMEDMPNDVLQNVGREMGKLHTILSPPNLKTDVSYGEEYFSELEHLDPLSEFNLWLKSIHQYIIKHFSTQLRKTLIHADLFTSNVIVDKNHDVTIMDMEEASFYYRVFDVGMAIVGTCSINSIVNLEKVRFLLKGYQEIIELEPLEKINLKAFTVYAAAATAFWRFRNFRFTKPDPAMFEHYLEMKNLADYVLSLDHDLISFH